jgi:hypothetical protein
MGDERKELPMVERAERCETCRYSEPVDEEDDMTREHERHCKRHPPVLLPNTTLGYALESLKHPNERDVTEMASGYEGDNSSVWGFPVVTSQDWCGEWKAKGEARGMVDLKEELLNKDMKCLSNSPTLFRVRSAFIRMGIGCTVAHLIQSTEAELLSISGIGEVKLDNIKEILRRRGLKLSSGPG